MTGKSPPDYTPPEKRRICGYGYSVLAPLFLKFAGQIGGARSSRDPGFIHDMRVASRRLRAALSVFSFCLPKKERESWIKGVRRITRALSRARDRDVQLEFLRDMIGKTKDPSLLPGLEYIYRILEKERETLQGPVEEAISRICQKKIPDKFHAWAKAHKKSEMSPGTEPDPLLSTLARDAIRQRLLALMEFREDIRDPLAVERHHAMRIAVKKLRYTLEVYLPLTGDAILFAIKDLRRLQDILGQLHDMDVWIAMLPGFLETEERILAGGRERSELAVHIRPGMTYLLTECQKRRAGLYRKALKRWEKFENENVADAILGVIEPGDCSFGQSSSGCISDPADSPETTVAQLAGRYAYESDHAHHVNRLSLALFDSLGSLHSLKEQERRMLSHAGILHDIGYYGGIGGHQKSGMSLILTEPGLPFSARERSIIGSVIRYHGREMPSPRHLPFGRLLADDRRTVLVLASLLRLADALDVGHDGLVERAECETSRGKVILRYFSKKRSPAVEVALSEKKGLFEETFQTPLEYIWSPAP
ncbi:MAG: CHAD domain-containing protein [Methanolinea sp.]|nr:CHAD domain-containing protein [Methanolinea sp.]